MTDIDTPTLYELVQMKEDFGLEGEDDTFLVVLLASQGGGFIVMKGPSRSGKDYTVEATDYCRTEGQAAFLPESSSKTALFEDHEKFNNAGVHIYPDMSADMPDHLISQIKRHGEGRPITHSYTDVTGGRETVEQTIHPPDAFIMFLASDNEDIDLNDYPEIRNRALIVYTDGSQEQNERVLDRQAMEESTYIDPTVEPERADEIRRYLDTLPTHRFNVAEHMDDGIGKIKVPISKPFRDQDPLPTHFPEVRMDFKRLMKFMKIMSIFHYQDRMQPMIRGQPTLMVTPVDGWLTMRVFGEKIIMSALNLEEIDLEILKKMREDGEPFTVQEMHGEIRDVGYHVTDRDIRSSLDSMRVKGYVNIDQSATPNEYFATAFANIAKPDRTFDWQQIVDETIELMEGHDAYPHDVVTEYKDRFCTGSGLEATIPFGPRGGEVVNITEWEGYSENVEEKLDKVDEINNEPVFGSASDDGDQQEAQASTSQEDAGGLSAFTDGGGDLS